MAIGRNIKITEKLSIRARGKMDGWTVIGSVIQKTVNCVKKGCLKTASEMDLS